MNRKELFAQLKANEKQLIQEKSMKVKFADSCVVSPQIIQRVVAKENTTKALGDSSEEPAIEPDTILVKVVANTANWMDSNNDVLTADAYKESIFKRGTSIPHILDHKHSVTSFVGDVQKVYTEQLNLKDLGLSQEGSTTTLIFETLIKKDYNPEVFKFYSNGKINQHSIGLTYQEIRLALDSSAPEDVAYKEIWDKYYPNIINKEQADKNGMFWAVTKVDVLENSAVLLGANELTPTLELSGKSLDLPNNDLPTLSAQVEQGENTMTELELALKKVSDLESELKQASALATKAERERTIGILDAAKTFKLDHETAIKAINKAKWDVEDVVDFFTTIKASQDASQTIDTSIQSFGKTSTQAVGTSTTTATKSVIIDPAKLFGGENDK
jgi:hypothetical protein